MGDDRHLAFVNSSAEHVRTGRFLEKQSSRLIAIGLLVLASLVVLWILFGPSGDPGGQVLHQLQPAAQALPSDARVMYRYDLEPKWDSCDGRQGTFGWDDVILDIHFKSKTPATAVFGHADETFHRLGWSREYDTGEQVGWTRRLVSGSVARAQLSKAVPDQGGTTQEWDLYVGAPPIGTRSSGC
jgi:hypothetical protein